MPNGSLKRFLKAFRLVPAGFGVLWPAIMSLLDLAPPFIAARELLVSGVGGVVLAVIYLRPTGPRRGRRATQKRLNTIIVWLAICASALVLYGVALRSWTVLDPQQGRLRFQIGFGQSEWSLTDLGRQLKRERPLFTSKQMLAAGGFVEGTAEKIWQPWTVSLAGVLLVVLFVTVFVSWIVSMALTAKELADST